MKADKFVKLLRTIISEEVRKVVKEELSRTLNEHNSMQEPQSVHNYVEPKVSLREKYRDILGSEFKPQPPAVPLNKEGKPALVNLSGNSVMNSILAETAQQMRQDPQAQSFFEGLR